MTGEFVFQKSNARSLTKYAYESIKQAIINGDLSPGDHLREAIIASQMGISRGPIREAFRLLDQEGLTYSHPYRGTVVLDISAKETEEIYVPVRRIIEEFVAQNAHGLLSEEDYEALEVIVAEMDKASREDNIERLTDLDIRFHTYLVEHASNPTVCSLWNNIISRIHARLLYQGIKHIKLDVVTYEHREYLSYIPDNNVEMIRKHLAAHIF